MSSKLVNVQQFIADQQQLHPEARGALTRMLWDLTLATKIISREVNKAGLVELLGMTDRENVQGEQVAKLDDYAQNVIERTMERGGHCCIMASEETKDLIEIPKGFPRGKYVLLFDPLDGSSNIDVNASIGTIFAIYQKTSPGDDGTLEDCLQPGTDMVAAGYVIYGSSTMLVYTAGDGVHGFTLDPSLGEFLLSHQGIRMPKRGKLYSVNEGAEKSWTAGTRKYIGHLKQKDKETGRPYKLRYIGTLVSDVHRTLLKGGIFLHPLDVTHPEKPRAKLRLLYEANPMAFLAEEAGGLATTGSERIRAIKPDSLHQRVPLVVGSKEDVEDYLKFAKES